MNWQTGIFNQDHWDETYPNLLFAADWAPVRALEEHVLKHPGQVYHGVLREEMDRATKRIVNVETTLLENGAQAAPVLKEGPCFGSPAEAVADLQAAGFDIGLLANNHLGDFGEAGIRSTLRILQQAGLTCVGCGQDQNDAYRAYTFSLGGRTVAIINFHEGEEGTYTERNPQLAGWDLSRVEAEVRRGKEAGHLVIVCAHAGREFFPVQPRYIQEAYRGLVEAGASAVMAHHPHVPCGMETWQGAPIVYSQGNFVFWSGQPGLMRRLGYLVRLALSPSGEIALKLIPYRITPHQLIPLSTAERDWLFKQLEEVSGPALSPDNVERYWEAAMDVVSTADWLQDATGMAYTAECMRKGDPQGLARLRTRLCCPGHYHFMIQGITRYLDGKHGQSDPSHQAKVRLWNEVQEDALVGLLARG